MNRIFRVILLIILLAPGLVMAFAQADSSQFYHIEGRIVDATSEDPIVFASIVIAGSSIGTVSNVEGDFILKIPIENLQDSIVISSLGYKNITLGSGQINTKDKLIKLKVAPIPLAEVSILNRDARDLLLKALDKIRDNYSTQPYMLTTFYRESIQRRRKYVSVSEAVLDGYKAAYTSPFERDRVSILKARKNSDSQKNDTLVMKLQGGPFTMFQLDFIKNPAELLERNVLDFYLYKMNGQVTIDNRLAYVISFEQLPEIEVPLYKGKFYIGVDDLAFMGAEFQLNDSRIHKAAEYMVQQKPPGVVIDVEKAHYKLSYRYIENKWHLSYVRSEIALFIKWEKKYFGSRYTMVAEMAVTDMDTIHITRFRNQDTSGRRDIFIEQVADFEDPGFWGAYNIIRPEESIQSALKRMGRKLKRKENSSTD